MSRFEKVLLMLIAACVVVLVVQAATGNWYAERPATPRPAVSPDAAVGKCIQGQRVFYHVTRGEAAEKCLGDLQVVGKRSFIRTWSNFETEDGLW